MREACLYNNWSFVPIFLKIYRALMRWTPWSFVGAVVVMSPHDGGTRLEWRVGGWGLSPKFFRMRVYLIHQNTFLRGEHSLHISWRSTHLLHLYFLFSQWRHQMETCSASLAFVRGIHRWLRGIHRSQVNSPHTDKWRGALIFSLICLNKRLSKQSRRRWVETPSRSLWRHCNVVPNSDQWSGQPWDLSAFNASLLSNFELVKQVKLGGSVHHGRNSLKFGTLLYPDYLSLKLTIICTQRQSKFVVSDHPETSFELGRK